MLVNWADEAREDLATIIRYIARRNPDAAERLGAMIERAAERIPLHPYIYRPGRVADTRETVVHPNYIIIYRVTGETVEILSVLHTRQQYP